MLDTLLGWGADQRARTLGGSTALSTAEYKIQEDGDDDESRPIRETDDYLALLRASPADRRWGRRGLVIFGRAFQERLRMGCPGERREGAAGSGRKPRVLDLRQSGDRTAGGTAAGDRVAGEGEHERDSAAAVDFGAVIISLVTLEDNDVFRNIVSFCDLRKDRMNVLEKNMFS